MDEYLVLYKPPLEEITKCLDKTSDWSLCKWHAIVCCSSNSSVMEMLTEVISTSKTGRRAVLLARWIVRNVPLGALGHEKFTHVRKTRSGGARKTMRREDQMIVWQALVDPTVTRSTIRADVGVAIVPQTISGHLAEANLKSKHPFRALPLTPEHRQLRLQWCQARSMWNVTDWQNVVFSDESWFVWGQMIIVYGCGDALVSGTIPPTLFYVTLPVQLV
ncbi:HTH_Tnp_Tc3_2 domain-containing protein [Trichonephila clavipes]|nr:HTH_Tnp_Tc3_2 domain-containing protein [Trichonephila clavipes]